jgi:hypothetical protein
MMESSKIASLMSVDVRMSQTPDAPPATADGALLRKLIRRHSEPGGPSAKLSSRLTGRLRWPGLVRPSVGMARLGRDGDLNALHQMTQAR